MSLTNIKMETPEIFQDMRTRLITAGFSPGEKLRPEEIRQSYGCSSNTIREVLMRLSSVGLVAFEEQRGFRARRTSIERLVDLTNFRVILEQQGVALSIEYGDVAWEAQLSAAHHKLSHIESIILRTDDIESVLILWSNAEWEFHETLLSASRSPLLLETYRTVYDQFRQQIVTTEKKYGYYKGNIAEHKRIVDAALARDTKTCQQRIYDHMARNIGKS